MLALWSLIIIVDITATSIPLTLPLIPSASRGDFCILNNSTELGRCSFDYECAEQFLPPSTEIPQVCGFSRFFPLVCCRTHKKLSTGTRSVQKCKEYFPPSCRTNQEACKWRSHRQGFSAGFEEGYKRCLGIDEHRIAFGEDATSKEFPHMAAIGYSYRNKTIWLCGGTLISHNFIITAAHCAYSREFGPATQVRLEDLDLENTTETYYNPAIREIKRIYKHPNYKSSSYYHDIALVELLYPVYFGEYIKPACLDINLEHGKVEFQVTGWGKTDYFGQTSSRLKKASLDIIKHTTCKTRFESSRKLKDGILDQYQICAGHSTGRDTCPGDSGGPLHYFMKESKKTGEHYVLTGVTSFGKGCGIENSAGVYTRIASYLKWIEDIVWPVVQKEKEELILF